MSTERQWPALSHEQRIQILATMKVEQILENYALPGSDLEAFRTSLVREQSLWNPQNLGAFEMKGSLPTKDMFLGAWRYLDRSEALLELIDNSIDAWNLRRKRYPLKTAKNLIIRIRFDPQTQQLVYEDNAGGVPKDKFTHLVVPGHGDTTDLTPTIGSYKTGGKKAIFRLATAANITTRYQDPEETRDEGWSIQLDQAWLQDSRMYEFPCAPLKDKGVIGLGQTRYTFQLREEPIGGTPWFLEPEDIKKVIDSIRRTYSLLLIRNPNIHIYFHDLKNPIKPLEDLYDFSGTNKDGTNLQPQQVKFIFELLHEGTPHKVTAEVVLGCRRTSRAGGGFSRPGIDLYGNNRLFVIYDQETFADLLPTGSARNCIRGFVNIHGPNVFIPWDTHKRHLNPDREIIRALTKNKLITDFFGYWYRAYQGVGRGGNTKLISDKLPKVIDTSKKDLFIPNRATVEVDLKRKRGVNLPPSIVAPTIRRDKAVKDILTIKLNLSLEEVQAVCSYFGISGWDDVAEQLTYEIKEAILPQRTKGGPR